MVIPELLRVLLDRKYFSSNQLFHSLPLLIYVLHPFVIIVIEKIYAYFNLLLPNIFLYIYTVIGTILLAVFLLSLEGKLKLKKTTMLENYEDSDIIEKM